MKRRKEDTSIYGSIEFTIGTLIGSFLNARKMRVCFVVWTICNVGWLAFDISNKSYPRAIQDIIQTAFTIYGLVFWKKKETK